VGQWTVVYNQNYWLLGLFPLSSILKARKTFWKLDLSSSPGEEGEVIDEVSSPFPHHRMETSNF
jgi:hypothetical protein